MKAFLKQNKRIIIICFIVFVIVAFLLAFFVGQICMSIPISTIWETADWASFLGSYIGGLATLAAVMFTFGYSRFESAERNRKEKEQEQRELKNKIEKSALIIYYDFGFAIEAIVNSLNALLKAEIIRTMMDFEKNKVEMSQLKIGLVQLHIDSQWIRNVAELKDITMYSGDINKLITYIYRIYGDLQTIEFWKKSSNKVDDYVAFMAISDLMDIDGKSDFFKEKEYISTVKEDLKKIAGIDTENAQGEGTINA